MPSLNGTREVLETLFIDGWAAKTPIKYDNVVFDDNGISEFVDMKMINYTTRNVNIGSGITKRKRHTGVFSIRIFTKQNTGTGKAYSYADDIGVIMDNFKDTNILTYASESRRSGEVEGGQYVLIVDVPYVSDET